MTRPAKHRDPFYLTPVWKALRQTILRRDRYICQICSAKCLGKAKGAPSPHVDHIQPRKIRPDLSLTPSNLRVLCHSCHSRVSINATMGTEKPKIGLDGFPVEEEEKTQLDIGASA